MEPVAAKNEEELVNEVREKYGEIAKTSRKHGFNLCAHASRQQGRRTTARDANDDRAAINDGRNHKRR